MTKVGVLFPFQMKTEMRQLISDYIPHYLWLRVTIYGLKMRMLLLFASELQGKLSLALAQSCLQPTAPPVQHSHPELCQRCPPVHSLIPLYWPLVNTLLFRVVWAFMTQCGMLRTFMNKPLHEISQKALMCCELPRLPVPTQRQQLPLPNRQLKPNWDPFTSRGVIFPWKLNTVLSVFRKKKQPTHSRQLKIKYDWTETENVCSRRKISE